MQITTSIRPHADAAHMPQLDSLRGLAVIGVIAQHAIAINLADVGSAGVRLFFVLSGFLITRILLKARVDSLASNNPLRNVFFAFYARRSLRIFPLYYVTLLLLWSFGNESIRPELPRHAAYLSNFLQAFHADVQPILGHFWSLSVEEQFYLLWPAVMLLTPLRMLPFLIVLMILTGPFSRYTCLALGGSRALSTCITTSCLDSLGAGSLLAMIWHNQLRETMLRYRQPILAFSFCLVVFVAALATMRILPNVRLTFQTFCYAIFSFWAVDAAAHGVTGQTGQLLNLKWLQFIGRVSYGIYILHAFVLELLLHYLSPWVSGRGIPLFLLGTVCSVFVAAITWKFFEEPINRLKCFFNYLPRPAISGGHKRAETRAISGDPLVNIR